MGIEGYKALTSKTNKRSELMSLACSTKRIKLFVSFTTVGSLATIGCSMVSTQIDNARIMLLEWGVMGLLAMGCLCIFANRYKQGMV